MRSSWRLDGQVEEVGGEIEERVKRHVANISAASEQARDAVAQASEGFTAARGQLNEASKETAEQIASAAGRIDFATGRLREQSKGSRDVAVETAEALERNVEAIGQGRDSLVAARAQVAGAVAGLREDLRQLSATGQQTTTDLAEAGGKIDSQAEHLSEQANKLEQDAARTGESFAVAGESLGQQTQALTAATALDMMEQPDTMSAMAPL